jgi:ribosomal protein S18 acetylase RimI-like enzyme
MEVIQGYADSPRIVSLSDDIFTLFKNIFPENNSKSFQDLCGVHLDKIYFIVTLWYGKPIAMAELVWVGKDSYWYMFNFGVRKSRRREGHGRHVLSLVKEFTKGKSLKCQIHNDNIPARFFYLKNGAEFTDQYDETNHFWAIL